MTLRRWGYIKRVLSWTRDQNDQNQIRSFTLLYESLVMKFSFTAVLLFSGLSLAAPSIEPEPLFSRQAAQSINDAIIKKGKKYFGTCTDPGRFNSGQNGAIIKANFGQVTPENR